MPVFTDNDVRDLVAFVNARYTYFHPDDLQVWVIGAGQSREVARIAAGALGKTSEAMIAELQAYIALPVSALRGYTISEGRREAQSLIGYIRDFGPSAAQRVYAGQDVVQALPASPYSLPGADANYPAALFHARCHCSGFTETVPAPMAPPSPTEGVAIPANSISA